MSTKRKPTVGEKLWMVTTGNAARRCGPEGFSVTVMSVGRKYFTVSSDDYVKSPHMHSTFIIHTWREKTMFSPNHALYESEEEWQETVEAETIRNYIYNVFQYGGGKSKLIPIQDLRQIKGIIDSHVN